MGHSPKAQQLTGSAPSERSKHLVRSGVSCDTIIARFAPHCFPPMNTCSAREFVDVSGVAKDEPSSPPRYPSKRTPKNITNRNRAHGAATETLSPRFVPAALPHSTGSSFATVGTLSVVHSDYNDPVGFSSDLDYLDLRSPERQHNG